MDLRYKRWDDVPLTVYNSLVRVNENNDLSEDEKNIALAAILCDVDEKEMYRLGVGELNSILVKCRWMENFDFKKFINPNKKIRLSLGGEDYEVNTDIRSFTYSQFVDFNDLYPKRTDEKFMAPLMATMIVPKGKIYGEYDMDAVIEKINSNLSISMFNSILFTFLNRFRLTLTRSHLSLIRLLKRMEKDNTLREQVEEMGEMIETLESLPLTEITNGLNWRT